MKKLTLLLFFVSILAQAQTKYSFVFLHKRTDLPVIPKEESDKIMSGHMSNMQRLAAEGKLAAAGPFEGGGGLFIFNSASTTEVKEWLSTDPGVQAHRWNVEILPYKPLLGGVCSVKAPYEMTMYEFIHFKPNVMKFNVQTGDETVKKHDQFIQELAKSGNVITHGSFGGLDGAIVVMKGEVQHDLFLSDPAVGEALYEPEFKKLYIAKGSFCEN